MTLLLPQTAEYALRVMTYMAAQPESVSARSQDIADSTGIPLHYLSKVLRRLVAGELLASRRGHGGGFTLSRDPASLSFAEILQAMDFTPTANRCSFGWGMCDESRPCPLHNVWSTFTKNFFVWAESTMLSDCDMDFFSAGLERMARMDKQL